MMFSWTTQDTLANVQVSTNALFTVTEAILQKDSTALFSHSSVVGQDS